MPPGTGTPAGVQCGTLSGATLDSQGVTLGSAVTRGAGGGVSGDGRERRGRGQSSLLDAEPRARVGACRLRREKRWVVRARIATISFSRIRSAIVSRVYCTVAVTERV